MVAEVDTSWWQRLLAPERAEHWSARKPYIRISRLTTMSQVTVPTLPSGLPRYYASSVPGRYQHHAGHLNPRN